MKRTLLIATLFMGGATFAQFTQANEPQIGDEQTFYVVDTLAPNYSAMTGTGVMWDYSTSGVLGTNGIPETADMSIVAPSSTPNGASFPSATKAVVIEGYMTSYFASSAMSRNSKGFVFDGTNVITLNDANDETLMNYSFAYGASFTDSYTGTANVGGLSAPLTGTVTATVDGSGTLKLNNTTTLPNVLRYKIVENATATAGFISANILKTQYEYYQLSSGRLPVFVHSKTDVIIGGGAPNSQVIVLNSAQPNGFVGVDENVLSGVTVFPNPANENIFVNGLKDAATLTLADAQGKTISTVSAQAGTASVNISTVNAGIYFLNITTEKGSKVERVVIR